MYLYSNVFQVYICDISYFWTNFYWNFDYSSWARPVSLLLQFYLRQRKWEEFWANKKLFFALLYLQSESSFLIILLLFTKKLDKNMLAV